MLKQRKEKSSILKPLAVTRIDSDIQSKNEVVKKEKAKSKTKEKEKLKTKEKKKKVKVDEEKCSYCLKILSMDVNGTRFLFSCSHVFHMECYEIQRETFKGALCPICFSDERFSPIFVTDMNNDSDLKYDIDHSFGSINLKKYYDKKKRGEIMIGLHKQIPFRTLSEISSDELNIFRNHDPSDYGEILKKANLSSMIVISVDKKNEIIRLFQKRTDVKKIQKLGYTCHEILMSGMKMDTFIHNGYNIKDIYQLGFQKYKDLIELQFHHHLMLLADEENEAIIQIQHLVDYYYIDWRKMIEMFAIFYSNSVKVEDNMNEMAVGDFCRLKLSKNALIKLKLTNINIIFTSFGDECLNADKFVDFCSGEDVNNVQTLMDTFKFYGKTMEKISGFTMKHIQILGWDERHPLRKFINILTPKSIIVQQKEDFYQSDDDNEIQNEEVSSSDSEEFSDDSTDDDDNDTTNQADLIDLKKKGMVFSDRITRPQPAGMSFSQAVMSPVPITSSSFVSDQPSFSLPQLSAPPVPKTNPQNSRRKILT